MVIDDAKAIGNNELDSFLSSDVFRCNLVFRLIYNNLINIIENNPIHRDTIFKTETYLFNQFKHLALKK